MDGIAKARLFGTCLEYIYQLGSSKVLTRYFNHFIHFPRSLVDCQAFLVVSAFSISAFSFFLFSFSLFHKVVIKFPSFGLAFSLNPCLDVRRYPLLNGIQYHLRAEVLLVCES